MSTHMLHDRPVFVNSALESGRRIEALRLRRVELRGREREAILAEQAAERAVAAETAAAGRKAASLGDETAVVRARTAVKVANSTKRARVKQAGELGAAVTAIESEIDWLLVEHRDELVEESREAYSARADAVLGAGDELRRALAQLREEAVGAFILATALSLDTSRAVQPDQVKRLERAVGELLGQVPTELPAVERALVA